MKPEPLSLLLLVLGLVMLQACEVEEPRECGDDADGDQVLSCADCDDGDFANFPGNVEVCDGQDNDCNGLADHPAGGEVDADGDGFWACMDCDDSDGLNFSTNVEACDGQDNDCNGLDDAGNPGVGAEEADNDGDGQWECQGDCDDDDATTFTGNVEVCDGQDNDCNGEADLDVAGEVDADADGVLSCGDCDDADASNFPGNAEACDGLDNDCDGVVGAVELDGDYDSVTPCNGDCDDADADIYPGAIDECDGVDNDCDGIDPCGLTIDQQAALDWATSIALLTCGGVSSLRGDLIDLIEPAPGDTCPGLVSTPDTGPVWFGTCPWSCTLVTCLCSGSSYTDEYTGGCVSASGATVTGSATDSLGSAEFSEWVYDDSGAESGWTLVGSAFGISSPTPPSSTILASFAGSLTRESEDSSWGSLWSGGNSSDCNWSTDTTIELEGGGGGVLVEGPTTLALTGAESASEVWAPYSTVSTSRSVLGTATAGAADAYWEVTVSADWSSSSWMDLYGGGRGRRGVSRSPPPGPSPWRHSMLRSARCCLPSS